MSTACEQKAGDYLIADVSTRPVVKPFSRSGLLFKGTGTPGDSSSLLVVMYIQYVELQGCSVRLIVT